MIIRGGSRVGICGMVVSMLERLLSEKERGWAFSDNG